MTIETMEQNEPDWPSTPAGPGGPRRGAREKWSLRKKLVVWGCTALAAVIVTVAVGVGIAWRHLNGNIKTEDAQLKPSALSGKQDILFIGSDSRAGGNQALGGGDVSGARSDTTMVFDSPADRREGTEVSIPRDSMVQIPDCPGTGAGGATVPANFGMFNSAFTEGGAPCTVKTVESLTGLALTHYIAIDFEGVVGVVNALGGVKVCVTQAIDDQDSGLNIPAGTTTLNGDQALAFVRLRHSIGNGSDLERIRRQQYFLDQLERQVRSAGLITDPIKLYKVLDAATRSITTDPGLGTVTDLYDLAQTLNAVPSGKISYVTVPNEPYPADANRVIWTQPDAANLWNGLADEGNPAAASAAPRTATAPGTPSESAAALGELEGVMKLELLAASATGGAGATDGAGIGATVGADSGTSPTAGAGATVGAGGTSSPGGTDVGTCPVA